MEDLSAPSNILVDAGLRLPHARKESRNISYGCRVKFLHRSRCEAGAPVPRPLPRL